jgi:large subunit ribosomal protein L10
MRPVIIQKEKIVQEIQNNLQNSKAVIFYDFHHIENENLFLLKKNLKKIGGFWKVYKNTLIKRALSSKKDLEFQQANALIFCQNDEYQPLKILNDFDQENFEKSKIKGG